MKKKRMTPPILIYFLFLIAIGSVGCQPAEERKESIAADYRDTITATDVLAVSLDTVSPPAWKPDGELLGMGKPQIGDLDSMIARRRIRALVPYTHTFYFIDGKERRGIAFEALNLFEKSLNQQLGFNPSRVRIVFIPVSREQIISLLQEGYGDLAVAGLTITPAREQIIDFSLPTITGLNEVVVSGPATPLLTALTDLAGQRVFVHKGSSYHASLQKLSDSLQSVGFDAIRMEAVDPYLEVEDVLEMVHAGLMPLTVVEEDVALHWAKVLDSLRVHTQLAVNTDLSYGWAFRKNSPQLKTAVDQFIRHNRKGTLIGNMLYNKYLKSTKYLQNAHAPEAQARLQATEAIFKKYSEKYDLDWLLLVAQGYQESQLNQQAVSKAGAVGIMQIKPSTAANEPINIHDVKNIDNNIHAASKYLRYLMDHYFSKEPIDSLNKALLALAAYNAGPTRISRLRKQAHAQGLDANRWFDNVEMVVAHHVGKEPVQYVSNIYKYYTSYRSLQRYADLSGKKMIQ